MQPATSNTRRASVIVVGSGIAGLAAARALVNADFKVTVLESRDRIGGRIYTNYEAGYPIDMGASWLHGASEQNPLASIIGQLHLPLYKTSDDNSVLFDHDLKSYALFDADGQQVPSSLVSYVGKIFEELLEEVKKLRTEFDEDISIQRAFTIILDRRPDLRLGGLAQKVIQWYICRLEGWFAADSDSISANFWDEEELLEGGHGLMINGYSPVTSSLAKGLDLRLNHRVTKVSRNFYGVDVMTADGKVFKADAAVICVPLGVLKAKLIKFEPKLPAWKEAAINDIGIGKENKIALLFKKACWPNVEFIGIVAPTTYDCSYFLNLHKATGHPVLVYMPAGRLADDIEKMSDDAAARFATTLLKRILPDMPDPEQYLVSRWGSDVDTLGAYSYSAVGKPPDLHERLRLAVDNVFFAGEATSMKFPGTVHGAFSSGVEAAKECRRRFTEQQRRGIELFQPVMAEEDSAQELARVVPLQISRL